MHPQPPARGPPILPAKTRRRADAPRSQHLEVALEHIDLELADRPVLRDVTWHLRPGERWILRGPNGAGKTQLLKLVAGDVWPTPGSASKRTWRWRGRLQREPLGVKEEIAYVGPERQDRYERYGWNFTALEVVGTGLTRSDIPQGPMSARAATLARSLLRRLGVLRLHGRRYLTLSYGERRLVLVARALASRPALLLLDEGLNGLDATNRLRLLRFLDGSRTSRLPWVLSTHRAEDVPKGATHLIELRAGEVVRSGPLTAADRRRPARDAKSATATAAAVARVTSRSVSLRTAQRAAPALITVEGADVYVEHAPVLRGIDVTIRRGECWVVHGGNGAGKSTLLRLLYGDLHPADGGRILRAGQGPGVPITSFRDHTGFISPQLQTDHPQYLTALEVAASGLHSSIGLNDPPTAAERRRAAAALAGVDLAGFGGRPLRELSYGQLRRVLFARALIRRPRLLLLDEPYAGLDPGTRADLLAVIDARIAAGTTVVLATHHRDEWPAATTHQLALRRGRIARTRGTTT